MDIHDQNNMKQGRSARNYTKIKAHKGQTKDEAGIKQISDLRTMTRGESVIWEGMALLQL